MSYPYQVYPNMVKGRVPNWNALLIHYDFPTEDEAIAYACEYIKFYQAHKTKFTVWIKGPDGLVLKPEEIKKRCKPEPKSFKLPKAKKHHY